MDYRETLGFLYSQLPMFQRIGAAAYKHDLSNTILLCEKLGNPQKYIRSVHIAGTNGKGSCAHLVASMLQECGYKTGLFTSPHLADFRERIRINGAMISEEYVVDFVARYKDAVDSIKPSFFEYTAGMALKYFHEQKVDIAVLETGMGGRLDSTNVVTPEVSVITNITMDHMRFLGDTIEKIALEKSGIIKYKVPVVVGETQPDTENIFSAKAKELQAPVFFADRHYTAEVLPIPKDTIRATEELKIFRNGELFLSQVTNPLLGNYQPRNIQTVLMTVEVLSGGDFPVSPDCMRKGIENVLANTGFTGRWQILGTHPLTICDVGHNEAGIRFVVEQIRSTPHSKLHFVLGMVSDKEISDILKLLPKDAIYYFCKADIPRGLEAAILEKAANKEGLSGKVYPSVRKAYQSARRAAGSEDLVFIGGSSFVVAEILGND